MLNPRAVGRGLGLPPYARQEMHCSASGLPYSLLLLLFLPAATPMSNVLIPLPPRWHSGVRNGNEANLPPSVPGHMKTKGNQRRRERKDTGQCRQMEGQGVGKGREAGEGGGCKPLPNHCKPGDEIVLGRGSWKNQLKEGGKSGQGLMSAEIHFH